MTSDGTYVSLVARNCYYMREFISGQSPNWIKFDGKVATVYTNLFDDWVLIKPGEFYAVGDPNFHLCQGVVSPDDLKNKFRKLSKTEIGRSKDKLPIHESYGQLTLKEEDSKLRKLLFTIRNFSV